LLKTLRVIYPRRLAVILRWGFEGRQKAAEVFAKAENSRNLQSQETREGEGEREGNEESPDEDEGLVNPLCFYCQERVSRPCWSCVECGDGKLHPDPF
jgi:hypothetical protein